jgi:gluconate 2-dehydrogenase gamma chain
MKITRRDWILGSLGIATWSVVASAHEHAHTAVASADSAKFEFFDAASAAEVSAMAAQVVPSDDGPGATEAGAVYFIDRALTTFAADRQSAYHDGLADLKLRREKMFPGSTSFASLAKADQVQLLKSIETANFFVLVRTHTVLAWLGSPEYGGNRNQVGWKYIGFDDAGFFEPPFGYYDAEAK